MKLIEEENCSKKLSSDRRLNYGRLYFLLEFVELIYEGDIDVAYNEIIRLYYLQGGSVFSPKDNISERNSDHFRPPELKYKTNKGAPPKAVAKTTNTKRTRKNLRNTKESTKEEIAYNSTKTQSYHDASNLIHNENSSIVSIYSNTNFQHELYPSTNISQPLHDSRFTYFFS
ncbi:unnamed protein product [Rhizophagus irregularis]|nr:unnamed protein product [Rhizophagus irregularis]